MSPRFILTVGTLITVALVLSIRSGAQPAPLQPVWAYASYLRSDEAVVA